MRAGVDPTTATGMNTMTPAQQQREIAAPGEGDGRRPEGGRARAQGAGEGRSGTPRGPSSGRSTTAIRTGGKVVTSRLGQDIVRGDLRDAVRGRQGQVSAGRAPVPTGARTWLDPEWRAGALAWAEARAGGARADVDRAVGAAARPAVVDRDPDPDRWRHRLVQGERARAGARGAVARGLPRAVASRTSCCRMARPPRAAVAAVRGRRADAPRDAAGRRRATTTSPRGSGSSREYAALQRSLEGEATRRRDAGARACPTGGRSASPASSSGSLDGRRRLGPRPARGT